MTALATAKVEATQQIAMTEAVPAPEPGATVQNQNSPDEVSEEPAHRKTARYVWALLLVRIYDRRKYQWDEVLPLVCSNCGGDMRIIAFMAQGHAVNEGPVIREILGHLGEPISAPRLAPARAPRCGSCRRPNRPSEKPIRRPSRHRTTSSISASPGEPTALQGGRATNALLAAADGRDGKDKGCGLSRDDSCMKAGSD